MPQAIFKQLITEAKNNIKWNVWKFQLFQRMFSVEYCGKHTYAIFTSINGAEIAVAHFMI